MPALVRSAPATSRWYGHGRALDLARRLESLAALSPPPGPAGVITARSNDLTVTFVDGLSTPLPPPWQPVGREARITWDDLTTDRPPDPDHPVFLVGFGTTTDDAFIVLNLAAFPRLRLTGDHPTATAVAARWVLELLATHPDIRIGLTPDAWTGPWTRRIHEVTPADVPDVDVLICGPELSYADRTHIVAATTSPILIDLGDDAAITTNWSITCNADHDGQIRRAPSATPMAATLLVPTAETLERCTHLMTDRHATNTEAPAPAEHRDPGASTDVVDEPQAPSDHETHCTTELFGDDPDATTAVDDAPQPTPTALATPTRRETHTSDSSADPAVAPLWNRLLGRITLHPPHPGTPPGPRERRLNELLVYLQLHRTATTDDIIDAVFGGAASEKTVTQQISMLRARLGAVYPGGPKALPAMHEGTYRLATTVVSDWMEFDRLVEILIDTTTTAHLSAAMNLVTGPPLGGITAKNWPCARDLRDQMQDRVAGAAVALARRHHNADHFTLAVEAARKGLWYDDIRQDLWEIALSSAREGRDNATFRALRAQFLNTIPGPHRDRAVLDLTT